MDRFSRKPCLRLRESGVDLLSGGAEHLLRGYLVDVASSTDVDVDTVIVRATCPKMRALHSRVFHVEIKCRKKRRCSADLAVLSAVRQDGSGADPGVPLTAAIAPRRGVGP